jgi:hypothetical protein
MQSEVLLTSQLTSRQKWGPAKVKQHVTYHYNNIEKEQSHSPLNDKRGLLSNLTGIEILV